MLLPIRKKRKIFKLYRPIIIEKTVNVINENTLLINVLVKNFCILLLSLILCIISPVSFVSKNAMGNLINLLRKSEINVILIRCVMCSISQLWNNSLPNCPAININWAIQIINIIPFFCVVIPISTIAWVRKGRDKLKKHPIVKAVIRKLKYFLCGFIYLKRRLKGKSFRVSGLFS